MPDPARSSPPPAYPRVVFVDRCVQFIDEFVQGAGALPQILRERKASRPSAVRKEPVTFRWEKRTAICIRDVFNDLPFIKDGRKLLRLMPSCSIIPGVTYLSIAASQSKPEHEELEAVGFYQLCLDTLLQRVLSMYEFPSETRIVPHSKTWMWDRSQQWREIMELRMEKQETKELRFEEEESKGSLSKTLESDRLQLQHWNTRELRMVEEETRELRIEEEKSKSSLSKMAECDSDALSPTLESLRLRSTKTVGVSPGSSKKPVGLQWVL